MLQTVPQLLSAAVWSPDFTRWGGAQPQNAALGFLSRWARLPDTHSLPLLTLSDCHRFSPPTPLCLHCWSSAWSLIPSSRSGPEMNTQQVAPGFSYLSCTQWILLAVCQSDIQWRHFSIFWFELLCLFREWAKRQNATLSEIFHYSTIALHHLTTKVRHFKRTSDLHLELSKTYLRLKYLFNVFTWRAKTLS